MAHDTYDLQAVRRINRLRVLILDGRCDLLS
jgi:hypothetical protein